MKTLLALLSLFVALLVPVTVVHAEGAAAIQQRMQSRLGAIDALKSKGTVGENNRGYLEARGSVAAAENQLISEENRDRAEVYGEIAKRTGGSADSVGRVRARKIAENSAKGIWLQSEAGEWYRK
jgi:uncharacterized protein YdbL (DUF1318 family)